MTKESGSGSVQIMTDPNRQKHRDPDQQYWVQEWGLFQLWKRVILQFSAPLLCWLIVEPSGDDIQRIDEDNNDQSGEERRRHVGLPHGFLKPGSLRWKTGHQ